MMIRFSRVGKALDADEDVVQVNVNLAGVGGNIYHDMTVAPRDHLEALDLLISLFKVRGHQQLLGFVRERKRMMWQTVLYLVGKLNID